jgi:hypothetical protein
MKPVPTKSEEKPDPIKKGSKDEPYFLRIILWARAGGKVFLP